MLLKLPDRALISFGFACQRINWFWPLFSCPPSPLCGQRVSAKSRDKMHNNFIHSGRCHKSVLNRVNNFVPRLPGQFLNCEESCCDMPACRCSPPTCTLPLPHFARLPVRCMFAYTLIRSAAAAASFAFIAHLGAGRLLIPDSFGPAALRQPGVAYSHLQSLRKLRLLKCVCSPARAPSRDRCN